MDEQLSFLSLGAAEHAPERTETPLTLPLALPHGTSGGIDLRHYQDLSVEALRVNIRLKVKNQVLCSPTGSGKTVIAAYLLYEAWQKGVRALFVCDRIALIDQTSEILDRYGIPHGVIQASHWRRRPDEKIQIGSAQTLARRGWPKADLIIVDECHTIINSTVSIIERREAVTIGLSATPFSTGLGKHYDRVVNVTTTTRLTEGGFLVPFEVYAASEPDMKGAKVQGGEWTDSECSKRAMPIIGDAVQEYLKHANGLKFIGFGCDVNHCEELKRQFAAAGVRCELYTYKTGDAERTEILREFRKPDSAIRGLISVAALSKGFDAPDVGAIIMCRPLRKSLTEHIQILGRGLRPFPGKEKCIVLDHSGNTVRFWDDMWHFFHEGISELDMGEKKEKTQPKKKEKEAVRCPSCFHVHDKAPVCPACGHVYFVKPKTQHESGELRKLTGVATASLDDKQEFYSMMIALRNEHNARGGTQWKPGWPAVQYRQRFGVWPRGLSEEPIEPSRAARSWLRSRWIAWQKSKSKVA